MEKKRLGDFELVQVLGKGPLGTLYLGEHLFLKKQYAIKVFSKDVCQDPRFLETLQEEMGKIIGLEHMNLVKIHNISVQDDCFFVICDLIQTKSQETLNLSQYLSRISSRLSEETILSILRQVAYALDTIHKQVVNKKELFHGNLKLNNIVIGSIEDNIPHVYLTDTGLAKMFGSENILQKTWQAFASSDEQQEKHIRSFMQNFAFFAPEQKNPAHKDLVGPKSDAYAFGILAYFLLMGYFPEGRFMMPSEKYNDFSFDWDTLIDKTLRQDPEQRPYSLIDLVQKIEGLELSDVEESVEKISTPKDLPEDPLSPPGFTKVSTLEKKDHLQDEFLAIQEKSAPVAVAEETPKPKLNPSELKKNVFDDDPGAIFQSPKVVQPYKPELKEVKDIEPLLTEMIVVEGGEYKRGSDFGPRDERPRHLIVLESFAMDIHPVTNEQFVRFLEMMSGEKDVNNNDMIFLKESRIKRSGGKFIVESGYLRHPVVGVSWYGAQAYAKWVGKRLPFESEWEVGSSLGKETNIYPFGRDIQRTQANFFRSDTTAVMSYPANEKGLFDMAGNVYEWCEDWYAYNFYEESAMEPNSPQGPSQGVYRVLRGGCWKSLTEDLRCSHRHRNKPGTMNRTYGFRCAADVT